MLAIKHIRRETLYIAIFRPFTNRLFKLDAKSLIVFNGLSKTMHYSVVTVIDTINSRNHKFIGTNKYDLYQGDKSLNTSHSLCAVTKIDIAKLYQYFSGINRFGPKLCPSAFGMTPLTELVNIQLLVIAPMRNNFVVVDDLSIRYRES